MLLPLFQSYENLAQNIGLSVRKNTHINKSVGELTLIIIFANTPSHQFMREKIPNQIRIEVTVSKRILKQLKETTLEYAINGLLYTIFYL